ncbi:SUKH-3 domain-containing protein [Micromonospora sp. SL4-19]|uniref:SUKH-3 domain-containing protein n=1 Tax=Micromonospora sp. SL4-19 TaxID=3399129 RepID=UPI003A4E447B
MSECIEFFPASSDEKAKAAVGGPVMAATNWLDEVSTCVAGELERLGWYRERSVDVSLWAAEITGDGFGFFGVARQFLESFGGMELVRSDGTGSLVVDPTEVQGYRDVPFVGWPARFDQQFCPIGVWDDIHSVFVGSAGLVLTCLDAGYTRRVADSPAEALHAFLCGDRSRLL